MSSRKGKAMGVGEIFVTIVRIIPRLGEEGQKELPTLLKRN